MLPVAEPFDPFPGSGIRTCGWPNRRVVQSLYARNLFDDLPRHAAADHMVSAAERRRATGGCHPNRNPAAIRVQLAGSRDQVKRRRYRMVRHRHMTRGSSQVEQDDWLDMWDAAGRVGVPVGALARVARTGAVRIRPNPGVNGGLMVSASALAAWAAAENAAAVAMPENTSR